MNSQQLGAHFEILTKDFFVLLLEQVGFQIIKERIQFNGNQNGFDMLIIVSKNYIEHKIFIECKNYSSDLALGNILKKAWDLEKNYKLNENDLFIAINSKSNFKNEDNSEKSSPILDEKFPFTSYFLDISNGIKPLFAINNDFYKALYGYNVDFAVDVDKQIDRFKSIILSRKPFLKPDFTSEDKLKFIGSYKTSKRHINRTFKWKIR